MGPLALTREVEAALAADQAIAQAPEAPSPPPAEPAPKPPMPVPSLEELEAVMQRCHGNVLQAARELGASRQQLYRWFKRRGIDPSKYRPE